VEWQHLCFAGSELDEASAGELERALELEPGNVELHVKCLGWLSRRGRPRGAEILWIVTNNPEIDLGGFVFLEREIEPEYFDRIRAAWDAHLASAPRNAAFLKSAAQFVRLEDPLHCEDLLRRGAEVEQENPRWHDLLGNSLMYRHALEPQSQRAIALAAEALAAYERAYALQPSAFSRHVQLVAIAKAAAAAGAHDRATQAATELLRDAGLHERTWQYGNSIHWANIVLGELCLARGDVAGASEKLLLAGRTRGSPQLDSFGPDLALAQKLLDSGETDVVSSYLEECGRFWRDDGRLAAWRSGIAEGERPDLAK